MIKKFLFILLMASLMFTVQISFIGCEDNNDDSNQMYMDQLTNSLPQIITRLMPVLLE